MTWEDRIRPAVYVSPSGVAIEFDFEDVSRSFDKRTAAFETAGQDGTYIQDSGRSGRRFPIRAFFSGENCDLEANAFEDALAERGRGRLQHPLYGTFDVVPFGSISRSDRLVTKANETAVDVLFWETTDLFPTGLTDAGSDLAQALEDFNNSAASGFENDIDLDSAVEESTFLNEYEALLSNVENTLGPISDTVESTRVKFQAVSDSINRGIDVLVDQPLALARQTLNLIQLPGRIQNQITNRLDAYGNLFNNILTDAGIQEPSETDRRHYNRFYTANLSASAMVTGSALSVVNTTFQTKPEAVAAAQVILDQFDALVAWRDDNYASLQEIDTGGDYRDLLALVAGTAAFLVDLSFSLKQERRLVLTRARTPVDLVAELYGEVDEQLDFFISSNSLTGSEILQIPAGREVVYYV